MIDTKSIHFTFSHVFKNGSIPVANGACAEPEGACAIPERRAPPPPQSYNEPSSGPGPNALWKDTKFDDAFEEEEEDPVFGKLTFCHPTFSERDLFIYGNGNCNSKSTHS